MYIAIENIRNTGGLNIEMQMKYCFKYYFVSHDTVHFTFILCNLMTLSIEKSQMKQLHMLVRSDLQKCGPIRYNIGSTIVANTVIV